MLRPRTALACAILAAASPAAGDSAAYPAGSLILPTGAAFQDDCGAVSVYGLVYDVLRANPWLAAHGKAPIAIHFAVADGKASPDRCAPTDRDVPPAPSADPSWNDGCDFTVTDAARPPVTLVDNTRASSASSDGAVVTFDTRGAADVFPQYPSRALTASSGVTTVRYLGGPFVIAARDAPTFLALLEGSLVARDTLGNPIDFSPFRSSRGACTFGATHYVYVHRAAAAFTAPAGKSFTHTPPRLALLATDNGRNTGEIFDGILEQYLGEAGLDFRGAQGCPAGGANTGNARICPGGATPGQIFDVFDLLDLKNDLEANLDGSGQPRYRMVWMPHWESRATGAAGPSAIEAAAMSHLAAFLDGSGGMMAECASIASLEGAYATGSKAGACPGYASCAPQAGPTQYQTCVDDGTGTCAAGTTRWGLNKDVRGYGQARSFAALPNCTDPTTPAGATCAYYASPGDSFAQTGDYVWNAKGYDPGRMGFYDGWGEVSDWLPNPATHAMYRPGVQPLISAVASLDRGKLASPALARTMVAADLATRSVKDNAPGKGNIAYVGGHDLTGTIAGTKVVLETLLQLGDPAPTPGTPVELSRASPVVATIDHQSTIVQGTFEHVDPAPARPAVNLAGDVAAFAFPYQLGHLRARTAASVATAASTFGSGTIVFDAASELPPVISSGCGASAFTGGCRTVFTTLATGAGGLAVRPPRVAIEDGNADALGAVMAPGLAHAPWVTLVDRVLAGHVDGSGAYVAALGGIDRSTVAVIGPSPVTGGARPTIAYAGATDGMLHAICASVDAAHGCDVLGRELWAFLPRVELPLVRQNTTRIDGSPRVVDLFGDFTGSGRPSFRTILTFQTGSDAAAGVYALDVTDPQDPEVVWELAPAGGGAAFDLGTGETLAAGTALVGGAAVPVVWAETGNGGTGGAAVVVTAIRADTGATLWRFAHAYPPPRVAGHAPVPATGIPGGAVRVDRTGQGYATDVVLGDLYGELWDLDAATGGDHLGASTPLLRLASDYQPIGAPPAIYSDGSALYAVVATGGYADLSDSTWDAGAQLLVAVRLGAGAPYPLAETRGPPDVPIAEPLAAGEDGYARVRVVGDELFVTTDTADVNAAGYGTAGGNTGAVQRYDLASGAPGATVVVGSGASSVANAGTTLYTSSGAAQQQLASDAASTTGPVVEATVPTLLRALWLRTE